MNDNKVKELLEKYYGEDYDENTRLIKDKAHSIEYITTLKYIDKYLEKGNKILEIGAATGRYSIEYARQGYSVTAVELLDANINILKSKITQNMNLDAIQANAKNLNMIKDNTYDITLCLGPLYHLYSEEDREQAIREAIRVTKKGGIIYFAYITNFATILSYGIVKGNLKKLYQYIDDECEVQDVEEEIFAVMSNKKFAKEIKEFNLEKMHVVASDGLVTVLRDYTNKLSDVEYEMLKEIHLKTCEQEDLLGNSSHILYIARK